MTKQVWAMLGLLSVLWGGSFFFVALAVAELPVFTIVWLRVCLAGLVLWGVIWATGMRLGWSRGAILACLGMGVLNNVIPFSLIAYGQAQIPSGLASVLNATTPLFTVVAAHLLTSDDKLSVPKLVGVSLGLAGVAVLVGPDVFGASGPVIAQGAVLAGALSYGLAGVWSRRFKRLTLPPMGIAAGQLSASSLLMLPLVLWVDRPASLPLPGLSAIGAVVGLAVLSTALAYVLFFRILDLAGPTNLSLVTLLIPVSAMVLGAVFLGEQIGLGQILGAGLIGLGLLAMDGRLLRLVGIRATPQA